MMQLDDVVGSTVVDDARFEEATHRTTRWLDRCIAAHGRPTEQNLFAIIQGGLDPRLRAISLEAWPRLYSQLCRLGESFLNAGACQHPVCKIAVHHTLHSGMNPHTLRTMCVHR